MVQSTVRLDDDFHTRVKIAIARRRIRSLQVAVEEALEMWMGENRPAETPKGPQLNKDEEKQVRMLLAVLRSGDSTSIKAVKSNLVLFYEHIQLKGLLPVENDGGIEQAV